ncbi:glycosyltransferase family A protein [Gloeocapsa sp. PCC 73106]|uniref:glycosyltransferase family 2 protein n=1 Tax=Gloeocapsa sp. PCC 73106 TaxID=102232 RepID=UPI0002ACFC6A|nr:putative glycosyltransferase [Gloeocapsa sp. PCC 73106]
MNIGVVIIGRNEGERFRQCLTSLTNQLDQNIPMVYVDSGSTDGSCEVAKKFGTKVIELDQKIPFTAARSRNTGLFWLLGKYPNLEYVQFIDGDCTLDPAWMEKALAAIAVDPKIAIVCGRRREKYPDASVYNLLAELEWNTPIGEARGCGGDALIRVEALKAVNGYNSSMICGEEPDMCIRMRQKGWKIMRIEGDMTWHDMAMFKLSQYWKRSVRGGWAVAEGFALYGAPPEKYMVKEHMSGWLWGLILPVLAIGLSWPTSGLSLLILLGYPILTWKIYRRRLQQNNTQKEAIAYAVFAIVFKFAQAYGQGKYWLNRWQGKQATLIEYKEEAVGASS